MTDETIHYLADLIGNATQCMDWKMDVLERYKQTKKIPPFFRDFYNLVSPYDEEANLGGCTLQTYLVDRIVPHVVTMRREMSEKQLALAEEVDAWKQNNDVSDLKVKDKIVEEEKNDWESTAERDLENIDSFDVDLIRRVADCHQSEHSCSVLSLFYHSAICVEQDASKGQKKYAFWPTVAPAVNNRHVELSKMTNTTNTGYVDQFCENKERIWSGQPVRILPYCISSNTEVAKTNRVPVNTVIGTVHVGKVTDEQTTSSENLFAGQLNAEQITYDEVKKLYHALTESHLDQVAIFAQLIRLTEHEKAILGFKMCLKELSRSGPYRGLATIDDWNKLYVQLWMHSHDGRFEIQPGNAWMHPTTINDLAHKTMILFMSYHRVRLCFLEGQKRATAAKYGLIGFMPMNSIKFHGEMAAEDYKVGGSYNTFNQPSIDGDWLEDLKYHQKNTFLMGARTLTAKFYHFKTEDKCLNTKVTAICKLYSSHLVSEGNQEQIRSWMNIVIMLADDTGVEEVLYPEKSSQTDIWFSQGCVKDYVRRFRKYFMWKMWMNERTSTCLKEDCKAVDNLLVSLETDRSQDFVDTVLFQKPETSEKFSTSQKPLKYRVGLNEYSFQYSKAPHPRVTHALCSLFLSCAMASNHGLKFIRNVATLSGERSGDTSYADGFKFPDYENEYVCKGLFDFSDNALTFQYILSIVLNPIEALATQIIKKEKTEVGKAAKEGGSKAMIYRVRCILTNDFFALMCVLGMRPAIPDSLDSHTLHNWMTKEFLNVDLLKRKEEGNKYSCSNLPVAIAAMIHLMRNEIILPELNLVDVFNTKTGDLLNKTKIPLQEFRGTFPITFTIKTGIETLRKFSFLKTIEYLIYGGNPFKTKKFPKFVCNEARYKPIEDCLKMVTFNDAMIPVLKGNAAQVTKVVKKVSIVDGFLPSEDIKSIRRILEDPTEGLNTQQLVLEQFERLEHQYTSRAALVRVHINHLQQTRNESNEDSFYDNFMDSSQQEEEEEAVSSMPDLCELKYLSKGSKKVPIAFPPCLRHLGKLTVAHNKQGIENFGLKTSETLDVTWVALLAMKEDQSSVELQPKQEDGDSAVEREEDDKMSGVAVPRRDGLSNATKSLAGMKRKQDEISIGPEVSDSTRVPPDAMIQVDPDPLKTIVEETTQSRLEGSTHSLIAPTSNQPEQTAQVDQQMEETNKPAPDADAPPDQGSGTKSTWVDQEKEETKKPVPDSATPPDAVSGTQGEDDVVVEDGEKDRDEDQQLADKKGDSSINTMSLEAGLSSQDDSWEKEGPDETELEQESEEEESSDFAKNLKNTVIESLRSHSATTPERNMTEKEFMSQEPLRSQPVTAPEKEPTMEEIMLENVRNSTAKNTKKSSPKNQVSPGGTPHYQLRNRKKKPKGEMVHRFPGDT